MDRNPFLIPRLPADIPPDLRKAIRAREWRMFRRSPAFWFILCGYLLVTLAAEVTALWLTRKLADGVQDLTYIIVLLATLPIWNLIHNRFFDRARKAIWLEHAVCPECGYNLTENSSGVCPECGASIELKR